MKTLTRRIAMVLLALIVLTSSIGIAEDATVKAVTLTSSQILSHAKRVEGTTYTKGYCLEWVATKFWKALGGSYSSSCCAYNYGTSRIVSTSKDNIPIGADVFFSGGSTKCKNGHTAGHIGVYIGDGKVINLIRFSSDPAGKARVRINTISQIEGWKYKYRGWGYHSGVSLQADAQSEDTRTIIVNGNPVVVSTSDISHSDAINVAGVKCDKNHVCCWGYAAAEYKKIWSSTFSVNSNDNMISNLSVSERQLNIDNIRYFCKNAKPGAVVRVRKSTTYDENEGHSLILIEANDDGGVFWEGNYNGTGLVRFYSAKWDEFVARFVGAGKNSIGYIQYPNAEKIGAFNAVSELNIQSLEFRDVVFPKTFKINTAAGWNLSGGLLVSDSTLKTISTKIIDASGNTVSEETKKKISGNVFYIRNLDTFSTNDNGVKFSKITKEGNYTWVLEATDSAGRKTSLSMPIVAKKTGKTVTSTMSSTITTSDSGVFKTIRKCKLYTGPGISNKKAGSKKKGAIIIVESGVTNEYGNLWYKTVDRKYIYSGDVEKVTLTETQASGTFKFNKDDESREWPYEAAKLIKKYSKGTEVQVSAKVVNTYGNTWYKLAEGGYVWEGDLEQQVTLSELEFKNVVYPSVFRISASGWYLSSGELTSNYELTSITSEIRKGDSTTVSKATKTIAGKSFSIKNLDDLSASSNDNGVRFSYIYSKGYGEGSYTWRLTATDASGAELALVMPFTATNSGGGMENIASIKYGDNKAKIKSAPVTGDIVKVSGGKYRVNNETMTAEYVEPTKKKICSVEIPATIEVAGGVYKVTAIGSRAFAGLENLTSVTIGKNVEKIGKKAFYKCLNLDRIKIKSKKLTADMIGKDAFKGISEKATIICPDELMKTYRKMILKNGASKSVTFK